MSRLTIEAGTTCAVLVPLALADPTGWRFAAQIRAEIGEPDTLAEWTNADVEARPYALVLPIDADASSAWTWRTGVLGIEATSPDGQVSRVGGYTLVSLSPELVRASEGAGL